MRVVVGTSPVLIFNQNQSRIFWRVTYLPSAIEAGNTGIVFINIGSPPAADLTAPSRGIPLNPGSEYAQEERYPNDPSISKDQIWAIAQNAGQVLDVEEISKPTEEKKE